MPRGGRRPGAGAKKGQGGKPPGTLNKRTREIATKAMEEGISPLEVMLDNMRSSHAGIRGLEELLNQAIATPGLEKDWKTIRQLLEDLTRTQTFAQECAKDAAPYMHPRLQSIEMKGETLVVTEVRTVIVDPKPED